ncbi:LysR family transcriptional regulator [Paraburkholderia oxyphila]|uniref:LysR family transcriptional regulator n=1 Tax=Paraburkholderia oxyphila TaxID=614212 RepID=UPI000A031096|nr:LysR family transcriptional regulator [Paraburkholderia oxyphila]
MAEMLANARIFIRVVECGSFTATANEFDSTPGIISRAVSTLEDHLGALLIHRTTRHLSITDVGDRYYRRLKTILADLDLANAEASGATSLPQGRIRIHSMPGLAESHMTAALVAWQEANPDVSVELKIAQRMPSLVEEGFDVSLLATPKLPDSGYMAKTLGSTYGILAASPSYLEKHGTPTSIDELKEHRLVRLESPLGPTDEWILDGPERHISISVPVSHFQANSASAIAFALRSGRGIGTLASYNIVDDLRSGALVRVLPQYRLRAFSIVALYPNRRYLDAKISRLLDFLVDHVTPTIATIHRTIEEFS